MFDGVDPSWKVVMRHDPRSKRIVGDREVSVFGASGSSRPVLSTISSRSQIPSSSQPAPLGEEVPAEQLNAIYRPEEAPDY